MSGELNLEADPHETRERRWRNAKAIWCESGTIPRVSTVASTSAAQRAKA